MAPVNLGNPEEYSILQLLDQVVAATGTRSQVVFQPLPVDDPRRRRPDIRRASQLLGWEPRVPLSEGLAITCAFFEKELYDRAPGFACASLDRKSTRLNSSH